MKKRIFKDWITYTLILFSITSFVILSGDCDCDIATEITYKTPFAIILVVNHFLIARHTNFYTEGF